MKAIREYILETFQDYGLYQDQGERSEPGAGAIDHSVKGTSSWKGIKRKIRRKRKA